MHRGYTSILRNGILKQYPPVLMRLGAANLTGNDLNGNNGHYKHVWHNSSCGLDQQQCKVELDGAGSSLNGIQKEEELRRACVQMIEQCQLMVRKLQLHTNRPNSKSARRRRNPRNLVVVDSHVQTLRPRPRPRPRSTTQYELTTPTPTAADAAAKTNDTCDSIKVDDSRCGRGPKLLQMYTAPAHHAELLNRRGSSRKRVLLPAAACAVGAIAPPTPSPKQQGCEAERGASETCAYASDHQQQQQQQQQHLLPTINNNSCRKDACRVLKSCIPVRRPSPPVQQPTIQLQLTDTPLQCKLRAEERARAKPQSTTRPNRSKTERGVDMICQSTMAALEQLGRLPRILQTPIQHHHVNAVKEHNNRSAKNSLPNLPFLQPAIKRKGQSHAPQVACAAANYPPKLLSDCSSTKQLYTRCTKHTVCKQTPLRENSKAGNMSPTTAANYHRLLTKSNSAQVRHMMTSTSCNQCAASGGGKGPPKPKDPNGEATCTGGVKNIQKCKVKPEAKTVCRPEMSEGGPCAASRQVPGPCRDELRLVTAAPLQQQLNTEGMANKGSKSTGVETPLSPPCSGTQEQKTKAGVGDGHHVPHHKAPGSCERSTPCQPTSSSAGSCSDTTHNSCTVTTKRATLRLRRPPIPSHLLKRGPDCFQPCSPKSIGHRRPLTNCDKMQIAKAKAKEGGHAPTDPMTRPPNPCAIVNRCAQPVCPVLHTFAPPPLTDADLPPPVMPFPTDLCGRPDPNAVPPWQNEHQPDDACSVQGKRPVKGSVKCDMAATQPKRPRPTCGNKFDDHVDECFVCETEAETLHPVYPDPVCPAVRARDVTPLRVKHVDVLRQVSCAKRCLTCEEQLNVDEYCDPCYRAKQLHLYSGTAYYDLHNYMAGRRRTPPGPANNKRTTRYSQYGDSDPC